MTLKLQPKLSVGWSLLSTISLLVLVNCAFIVWDIVYSLRVKLGDIKEAELHKVSIVQKEIIANENDNDESKIKKSRKDDSNQSTTKVKPTK